MKIISKSLDYQKEQPDKTAYKAVFTTDSGVMHRVDFDSTGFIENLCVYTGFSPHIHANDMRNLAERILEVIDKDHTQRPPQEAKEPDNLTGMTAYGTV